MTAAPKIDQHNQPKGNQNREKRFSVNWYSRKLHNIKNDAEASNRGMYDKSEQVKT